MTKPMTKRKKRRQPWFAPRQVYLRTGQGSSYVELSTTLQVGVAIGFGLMTLWLLGASYSAARHLMDNGSNASLVAQLESSQQKLVTVTAEASKIPELEAALADARASIAEAQQADETTALSAELAQTQEQLEALRKELSKSKAEEAALQATLEALAAEGESSNTQSAEEAASLHAQLEDAFVEIEDLEKARDEADARVAALTADNAEKDDNAERNETLLKAATEEIERLQRTIADGNRSQVDREAEFSEEIDLLTSRLNEEMAARKDLEQRADRLEADLESRRDDVAESEELRAIADADLHAAAIAAELKEAELLATIDNLRVQIASKKEDQTNGTVDELKEKLALAEAEIETLLKNTLSEVSQTGDDEVEVADIDQDGEPAEDVEQLKSELSMAKGEIIKLQSDIRAAKKRLTEQSERTEVITSSKSDNNEKLKQQLAATRSRMQQLNKALADAKLREVAIDLALISVVPSPSPPAPR